MKLSSCSFSAQHNEVEKRCMNSELWHACAGPLVSLPTVGSRVVYFPQGHSEQVAASTNREVDAHIPNYSSLPPQLICQLHNVTMHADVETDEVYAQMTLQPLSTEGEKETYLPPEICMTSKQPTNYFCKTLTASDTSTHGGFSVPRRAAEKVFPPLDFNLQPPAQELIARDLHNNEWKFRHIFRGQPKRHLLTTGWSVFVSAKRLVAGDSVLFIWNEKNQLLLGIRRANRPQTVMPSSVLSSDSMHLGLLAAAAHAAATNSRFTIFYNPRATRSEFVIPLSKYIKAVYHTRVSVGMRFRMMFETEESSVRRFMGTITGISDIDPVRWTNSYWRSVKVGWDESTAGDRQPRVSLWEIEPLTTFPMYPSPFSLGLKRPWQDDLFPFCSPLMWLPRELQFQPFNTTSPWISPSLDLQGGIYPGMGSFQQEEGLQLVQQPQLPPEFLDSHLLDVSQSANWFSPPETLTDPQNPLLFGVNLHASSSSLSLPNEDHSSALPYIDDSVLLHSALTDRAFVKVYKTGSFGRSLDITKFGSYQELRSELGRMFGLEGKLEDPVRSGWQLVFVDRENDVLLVGDDPWPEFVNSVSCIKILSPDEVEQMGQSGLEMVNSVDQGVCDDLSGPQDCRNLGRFASFGSLDY